MQNLTGKTYFTYYSFAYWWSLVLVIHFCIFFFHYQFDLDIALADSLIFNGIFAIISIGLWFWVRYSDFETQKLLTIFINHLASLVLSVVIWEAISNFILQSIFSANEEYIQFLKDSQVNRAVIGILLYMVVTVMYYLIIYIQNFREQLNRETEMRTLIRDAELNWLKLQINPHFLFNSLNSISSLTMSNPDKAQDMIIRLSELLRYSLKQSPQSLVPLKDEIDNCTKYLEIEKVRFGQRLTYTMNIPDEIIFTLVPAMILQPLFENAIKHGVSSSPEIGVISARVYISGGYLQIEIANTISAEYSPVKGTGVGISNISRRLSLIFGQTDLINSNMENNMYRVVLKIPMIKN